MVVSLALLMFGALAAVAAPRLVSRTRWRDREPVTALWVWSCVVAAVLLSFALSMTFSAAAAWTSVGGRVFATAPRGVAQAYAPGGHQPWSAVLAVLLASGGLWTLVMLIREILRTRGRRERRRKELLIRAPALPGEVPGDHPLLVLEGPRPHASWLPGTTPRLVITTAALRRLKSCQLDAVLAHEWGHVRARHDWLRHCSCALADGFPQVPVFAAFRDDIHRLVEWAADDAASRLCGHRATALALVELNRDRGVFGPLPVGDADLPRRVDRLLSPRPRLAPAHRLRLTAVATLVPAVPLLVALLPALRVLA